MSLGEIAAQTFYVWRIWKLSKPIWIPLTTELVGNLA
jgi:hypothetical protein